MTDSRQRRPVKPTILTVSDTPILDNGTFIFSLPGSTGSTGSTGACKGVLRDQLDINNRPCDLVELMPRLTES